MARRLPLADVRPTQLYLSAEKLAAVLERFDADDPDYGPLPAFRHDGAWHLADGHTRAFVASLAGADALHVERDGSVREACDFGLYLTCVEWCAEAGLETVADLHGRVLDADAYERRWLERCRRAAEE